MVLESGSKNVPPQFISPQFQKLIKTMCGEVKMGSIDLNSLNEILHHDSWYCTAMQMLRSQHLEKRAKF